MVKSFVTCIEDIDKGDIKPGQVIYRPPESGARLTATQGAAMDRAVQLRDIRLEAMVYMMACRAHEILVEASEDGVNLEGSGPFAGVHPIGVFMWDHERPEGDD